MSRETVELVMLRGIIADAPEKDQAEIHERVAMLTDLVRAKPGPTLIAISMVALQAQICPQDFGLPG